jgi:rhamnogalacturonan endolyase
MKLRLTITSLFISTYFTSPQAQTAYNIDAMSLEALNRGVVAVKTADGRVAVSWRKLRSDSHDEAFDVMRNGLKLNNKPLTQGGTFFIDEQPLTEDAVYEVSGGGHNGQYTLKSDAPIEYLPIAVNKPQGRYTANDASVGDVDGDGQYEIFLKWEPWNAHDNSHDGYTDPALIDCYRLDGTQLWRIDLGRNIRAGAHYTQFMVYDFDGDGRAEMMCKTADGTRDGMGTVIGDSTADWRNDAGRILEGPEYLTVFDGMTGRAMDTKPYIPERGDVRAWGDSKANRSDRFLAAVAYLDGRRASALFCRGYYTRTVIAAWDWDGNELKSRWTFDTNNPQWAAYAGQGNHNLRVADVDGDGKDEIIYGSMTVDDDGTGLYNTGFGHGDALHLVVSPDDNRLYVWDCHENRRDGSELHDAATGKVVFQIKSRDDVGRCMAADIDPTNPGMEMWSTDSHGLRTMTGEVLLTTKDASDPQHNNYLVMNGRWLSVNFGIWWDGDLLRELLDRATVTKYDWRDKHIDTIQRFDDCQFNNGTKSNPCLSGDIIGDWREEVLTRNRESTELRLYVTTIPTDHRINCLMHDIPYRLSIATENVGYNQPPEPGFYLGEK